MNLDQTTAIRIAIRDTTGAIARQETPEPTRTALQAHLDALLKEELRALTGQAPEGNLTVNSDDDWVDLPGPPPAWANEPKDPHAELRKTWAPGQRWQTRVKGSTDWLHLRDDPCWHSDQEYRQCE